MDWKIASQKWLTYENLDPNLKQQLNQMDSTELEEAFHEHITFGTGGMRGKLGPGINRMNIYTVRRAAKGLALHIEQQGTDAKQQGVVVAHDPRHQSSTFALEVAKVLGVHGIKTYLFKDIRPTPLLSFAVRYLSTAAGVMITASHNPPEYNGFKVYNEEGAQLSLEPSKQLLEKVNSIENEFAVDVLEQSDLEQQNLLVWLEDEVDNAYLNELNKITINKNAMEEDISVVFTPLHGTASQLVEKGLTQLGVQHLSFVEEQRPPDPDFTHVELPNPEEAQAFEKAIKLGEDINADVLMATDPDADRIGVATRHNQEQFSILTGNQLGALILDYILTHRTIRDVTPVMFKTIVTSELGADITKHHGGIAQDVLTGFKFIAEKIKNLEKDSKHQFVFGYEESYGCLVEDFVRDKDAIQAAIIVAEMVAYYKAKNMTLYDRLEELYEQYGYYLEDLHSLKLEGLEGMKQIDDTMTYFRNQNALQVDGLSLHSIEDYVSRKKHIIQSNDTESIHLPKANVVKFKFTDGSWCCLRPSGTEPKLKFYFGVKGKTAEDSQRKLSILKESILSQLNKVGAK
ncbi:phospho-sugar mutase [Piscibacillus halophilus]|uniref:Phosphoglucomutase n=1 Tax=Piscibacillus halophilus TaxID=571933 RepID=A0A1H9IQV0_9BACI|nr:phospho-sugar mutase [Piscibacillus halophilus]SEQ76960.1 alpha-phosphoglucomutase [Piscibacillus halophilus]